MRLYALIKTGKKSKVRHFRGFPPQLTGGKDDRKDFPAAGVLVIEKIPDGIFLIRYTQDGSFAGDTWHKTVEDAKNQANYEYGKLLREWQSLSNDVTDIISFILSLKK